MCVELHVKFKQFTNVLLQYKVIWVLTSYRLVDIYGRFQGLWCLNFQTRGVQILSGAWKPDVARTVGSGESCFVASIAGGRIAS